MNTSFQTYIRLKSDELKSSKANWAELGDFVLEIEKKLKELNEKTSITDCVTSISNDFNVHPSALWVYRKAVDYCKKELAKLDVPLNPDFIRNPPKIGPNGIVLLERISRAAPASMFNDIASKSLSGKISRNSLRDIWDSLKPALEGKTARGRGANTPKVKIDREEYKIDLDRVVVYKALSLMDNMKKLASSVKAGGRSAQEVLTADIFQDDMLSDHTCDFVIVSGSAEKTKNKTSRHKAEIHSIKVAQLDDEISVAAKNDFADFKWIAITSPLDDNDKELIRSNTHDNLGILIIVADEIDIVKLPAYSGDECDIDSKVSVMNHLLSSKLKSVKQNNKSKMRP